jgi:hypothetical protein
VVKEQTQGSETSQYLEKKKTRLMIFINNIPLVAASEKGEAQTKDFFLGL